MAESSHLTKPTPLSAEHHRQHCRGPHRNKFDSMPAFQPFDYQNELFEKAKKQNTVICLGTGTGKTYIAIMLIKHFSHEIRGDFKDSKRTVFLVPKVCLVEQQANVITQHSDLVVGEYIGEINVDTWDMKMWQREFESHHVLVMTAEISRVIVTQAFIPLSKINLVIFDEAHHCAKNHPYNEIMKAIKSRETCHDPPHILGLSASLINAKAKPTQIKRMISELRENLNCSVETASDIRLVNKHGATPKEIEIIYDGKAITDPDDVKVVVNSIHDMIIKFIVGFMGNLELEERQKKACERLQKCLKNIVETVDDLGLWCVHKLASMYAAELTEQCAMAMQTDKTVSQIYSVGLTVMTFVVRNTKKLISDENELNCIMTYSKPKMLKLLEILKDAQRQTSASMQAATANERGRYSKALCGIVFVERRATVALITSWLQQLANLDETCSFLKVEGCVRAAATGGTSPMINQTNKRQQDILNKFRRHEYNILVSTSVLEEGLDVPHCNYVIRFDFPKTVSEYVQSKGRARADKSSLVFMLDKSGDMSRMLSELADFREVERILTDMDIIKAQFDDDGDKTVDDDEILPPFVPNVGDGNARVTINSAISIVNRYCIKLPSDSFTKLAPHCTIRKQSNGYVCELRLPINSKVRGTIVGNIMENSRLAKKAAALEAVKKLYEAKELDDHFLPTGKEVVDLLKELEIEICPEEVLDHKSGTPRAGTRKRRQHYDKSIAKVLRSPPPKAGENSYLYVFTMKLICAIPEEQNTRGRKICDPSESERCFGVIVREPIPPICDFPVFTRSGEVNVGLSERCEPMQLNQEQLDLIEYFHRFTFNDVLRLEKYPVSFDVHKAD